MLDVKKSVSSWKEKNVMLKEKHLHAPKTSFISAVLQNFHKKVYISNVIILKNEKIFSKMIFLKKV
jgi:hypothetical protein